MVRGSLHSCGVSRSMPSPQHSTSSSRETRQSEPDFSLPRAALAAVLVLILIPARPVFAWGRMAHRASAKLADSRLSPRTRAIIRELLEPGESLADASTWADEHNREIRGSTFWHFVNVPIWAARYDFRDCRSQGCVISKISDFFATKTI